MDSPFSRFTDAEVREILRGHDLPPELTDENVAKLGLVRRLKQRDLVLAAFRADPNVDAIFEALGRSIPKSSIRSYLCRAHPDGEWRQRRRRRTSLEIV